LSSNVSPRIGTLIVPVADPAGTIAVPGWAGKSEPATAGPATVWELTGQSVGMSPVRVSVDTLLAEPVFPSPREAAPMLRVWAGRSRRSSASSRRATGRLFRSDCGRKGHFHRRRGAGSVIVRSLGVERDTIASHISTEYSRAPQEVQVAAPRRATTRP